MVCLCAFLGGFVWGKFDFTNNPPCLSTCYTQRLLLWLEGTTNKIDLAFAHRHVFAVTLHLHWEKVTKPFLCRKGTKIAMVDIFCQTFARIFFFHFHQTSEDFIETEIHIVALVWFGGHVLFQCFPSSLLRESVWQLVFSQSKNTATARVWNTVLSNW